jgi:exodeoxyribonuclease VII small subunit
MSRRKNSEPAAAADAPNFEKSLARLEEIVEQMENGTLPLDALMSAFEEGQQLIKVCSERLNEVERRIEVLVRKDGHTVAEPFETETGDEADAEEDGVTH